MKNLIAVVLTLVMLLSIAVLPASAEGKGKILYLSNLNSGAQYEFYVAYLNMMAENLGYKVEIVYGDSSWRRAINYDTIIRGSISLFTLQ